MRNKYVRHGGEKQSIMVGRFFILFIYLFIYFIFCCCSCCDLRSRFVLYETFSDVLVRQNAQLSSIRFSRGLIVKRKALSSPSFSITKRALKAEIVL